MCMLRGAPAPLLNHGQPKMQILTKTASFLVSGDSNIENRSYRCFDCWLMQGSVCNWTKPYFSKNDHLRVSHSCAFETQCIVGMLFVGGTMSCRHAVGEQTCVVVLLVLGLVLFLFPEVSAVFADSVGDTPLLGSQRGAHHAVHGPPVAHV